MDPAAARFYSTFANGLMASIVAFLVGGAFLAQALNDLNWMTFALVAILDRLSASEFRERSDWRSPQHASARGQHRIGSGEGAASDWPDSHCHIAQSLRWGTGQLAWLCSSTVSGTRSNMFSSRSMDVTDSRRC